jgi:aspartate aminotransferase
MSAHTDIAPATYKQSSALAKVGPSAITRMMAATAEMRQEGRDVVGLHVGEPDFETPRNIIEAAIRAMREGKTRYTALDGAPEVKAAVREKFSRENCLEFAPNEVMVAAGAKMILFCAFFSTIEAGDEVILPTPYWVSYSDIVEMMGATPVVVPTTAENRFKLQAEDMERAITPNTRWVLINSPSNPSGTVYKRADYEPLLRVLERHPHVWLMVDDMYEHIVFSDAGFVTPAQLRPDLRDRILTINGVSKAYAMTGWRIGYAGGPARLIKSMLAVLSQSTSCACSIAQAAAAEALTGPQDSVTIYLQRYRERRDLVLGELATIPSLRCHAPEGTFYTFVDAGQVIGRKAPSGRTITQDEELCEYLLRECGVAVIPGSPFGSPGYFRISFSTSDNLLREGISRIRAACAALA